MIVLDLAEVKRMAEYIEREALLQEDFTHTFVDPYDVAIFEYIIERAPAADVAEVQHGEWEDKPSGRYLHMASWCSVCGQKSGIGGIESNRHKPYCPNCGAKMDGKGEGE
jgi:hypothetical protein